MKSLQNKNNIFDCLEMLGYFILFSGITFALHKSNCQPFQLLIDSWFYVAGSIFLIGVLLFRDIFKSIRWPHIAVASAYYGYAIYYLITHNNDYGYQYRNYLIFQFLSRGLFLLVLVDVIYCQKARKINLKNRWYVIVCSVSLGIALSLNYGASEFILFPMLALLVTNISFEKWEKITISMSAGCYLMWLALMVKSFIQHPYGQEGRYYSGNFGSPMPAALLAVGAFVSALYLLDKSLKWSWTKINRTWRVVAICISFGCLGCSCLAISMIGLRSAQLAEIVTLFTYILLYDNGSNSTKIKKKRIWMISVAAGMMVVIALLAIMLARINIDWKRVADVVPGSFLKNKITFLGAQIESLNNRKPYKDVLPAGSVWNAIDRLSADRISIWYEQIKHMNLWGASDIGVLDGNGPHSVYLWILRKFGWIGGIPLCICLIWGEIICIKGVIQRKKEYMCSFLWSMAFLTFGLTDQVLWQYNLGFFFIIMLYPLMRDMEKA